MSDVILWRLDAWRCELAFESRDIRLRLYDGLQLISDELVAAGLDAWEKTSAWKTALMQVHKDEWK